MVSEPETIPPAVRVTLTWKIASLLLLPVIATLVVLALFAVFLGRTTETNGAMVVAARLPRVAEQLRHNVELVRANHQERRAQIQVLMVTFEQALHTPVPGAEGDLSSVDSQEITDALGELQTAWAVSGPRLRRVVAGLPEEEDREEQLKSLEAQLTILQRRATDLTRQLEERQRSLGRSMGLALGGLGLLNVALFLVGIWVTRRYIVRPVLSLLDAARSVCEKQLPQPVAAVGRDELGTLTQAFNSMTAEVYALLASVDLERRYAESIIQGVPSAILVLWDDLTIQRTNRAFRELFPSAPDVVRGMALHDVLPVSGLSDRAKEVLQSGRMVRSFLFELPGEDGTRTFRAGMAKIHFHADRQRILLVLEDLTEEERLRTRARQSERRFLEVVENATDGIVLAGKDGKVTFVNRAAERMFGWERGEIQGKPMNLLLPEQPATPAVPEGALFTTASGTEVHELTCRVEGRRKDGSSFPAECAMSAFVMEDETVMAAALRDITEREQSQERMVLLASALDVAANVVVLGTEDGKVAWVNHAFTAVTGFALEDVVGRIPEMVFPPGQDKQGKQMLEALRAGKVWHGEVISRRKDGSTFTHELTLSPVRAKRGEVTHFVAVSQDVTERKQMQARLMLADRMASVGTLAAGVAHEINNPLAYVIANLDYARRELGTELGNLKSSPPQPNLPKLEEVESTLGDAMDGAERVRLIVRDLKTFSRGDDDRRIPLDVRNVLDQSITMAWNELRHRAKLVKDYGAVPPVEASESRLGQVFLNLLINAAQAIPEGNADHNEIRVVTRTDEQGRTVIEIRDSGPGIPPEVMEHIFEPFFTTKGVGEGTGLGLSICHGIVKALAGEISVESRAGNGSTFRVCLPPARALAERPVPQTVPGAACKRGRILVVDDEPMVGAAIRRALASEHEVVVCTRSKEALAMVLEGAHFDLIVCDLMMPEMSGVEMHNHLSEKVPELASRMVFVTGGAFTEGAREFLDHATHPCIDKPFDPAALRALVRDLVQ